MDVVRGSVRGATLMAIAAGALLLALALWPGPDVAAATPVTARDGSAFALPSEPGVYPAAWNRRPILVFVEPASLLNDVNGARGPGQATASISIPGHQDLRAFALSAVSTHLGCIVGWKSDLGASKDIPDYNGDGVNDGRILDPCGFGQWDAFHRGAPQPGTPATIRLAALQLSFVGGTLEASGFDGRTDPVGHG